ncbi:MAG: hypothetical protein KGL31_10055 [candidate division NC10 bacterium]|nr:hypothetical protein [candidate division NC10 bacterium]MDE2322241.1 hypothetical protein [candidate division NC10 bacterium]
MRRKFAVAVLALGIITFVGTGVFWAERSALAQVRSRETFKQGSHLAQAIEHIEAAIKEQGKPKYEASLDVHLTEARQHAEASKQEKANPHLDAALKELNAAIVDVEAKHADMAVEAAKRALEHLKAVK